MTNRNEPSVNPVHNTQVLEVVQTLYLTAPPAVHRKNLHDLFVTYVKEVDLCNFHQKDDIVLTYKALTAFLDKLP
jgi:hypothetical protein